MSAASSIIGKKVEAYAPIEKNIDSDTEKDIDSNTKNTISGVVESAKIKDGTVYMEVREDATNVQKEKNRKQR